MDSSLTTLLSGRKGIKVKGSQCALAIPVGMGTSDQLPKRVGDTHSYFLAKKSENLSSG